MSDWKPTTSVLPQRKAPKRGFAIVAVVAVAAAVCGGVIFQVMQAEQGIAADGRETAQPADNAGKAKVGTATKSAPYARVNGELITHDIVAAECLERHGAEVLDGIINRTIIQQACRAKGVEVSAAEVNAEVMRIAKRFELPVESWYQMLQAERNITPMQYQRDVIWPMLALKKLAGENIEITEKDMQQAFLREYGPRVKAKMIMLDNFNRAKEIWAQAQAKPEDFGRLAREHSVEPTSRALDGDIPPIRRYSGNEDLVEAAFNLKEGEISAIRQAGQPGENRYVILLSKGQTEPIVKFEEVKEELHAQLHEQKVQESVANLFEKLKEQSRIDNLLTNTSTSNTNIQRTSGTAPAAPKAGGTPTKRPAAPVPGVQAQPQPQAPAPSQSR